MLAQKRTIRVTLDVECYDDLYLEEVLQNVDFKELLELEGDENVDITIKDHSDIFQCAVRGSARDQYFILNNKILMIINNGSY